MVVYYFAHHMTRVPVEIDPLPAIKWTREQEENPPDPPNLPINISYRSSLREEVQEVAVRRQQVDDDGVIQQVILALLVLLGLGEVHPVGLCRLGDLVLRARQELDTVSEQARDPQAGKG